MSSDTTVIVQGRRSPIGDVSLQVGKIMLTFAVVFALLFGILVAVLYAMGTDIKKFIRNITGDASSDNENQKGYAMPVTSKAVMPTPNDKDINVRPHNYSTAGFGLTPVTQKPKWQTKAPVGTTGPPINTPSNGSEQPKIKAPTFPGPVTHPYDPSFPIKFPAVKPENRYTGMPMTQKAIDPNSMYNTLKSQKLPTSAPPMVTNKPSISRVTRGPMVPHTQKPTLANRFMLTSKDSPGMCPVIQPTGKLALAEEAWNQGKRHGNVVLQGFNNDFDDGFGARDGTIDMGKDGGWYDVDEKGCCDHYCRSVNYGGTMRWSCIPPQAPNAEYSTVQPKGNQCSTLAGPIISKNIHPASDFA